MNNYRGRKQMCKTNKNERLKEISKNNNEVLNGVIEIINKEIKLDLYKEVDTLEDKNINNITSNIIKSKSFYKQVVKRLLNLIERKSMKERILFQEIEKGNHLLQYKRALTVKSPAYDNQASFNEGYRPNTHESALIDIYEEEQKQKQRIINYDSYVKDFEKDKIIIQEFIELLPNTKATEVFIRHFINGDKYSDIAKVVMYEEVYYLAKRGIDDLALILMSAL